MIAKCTYKDLIQNNKSFALFLQVKSLISLVEWYFEIYLLKIKDSQKNSQLKRYQIPDCLTIITQRLSKHLTLMENMLNNSKGNKFNQDIDSISQTLLIIYFQKK